MTVVLLGTEKVLTIIERLQEFLGLDAYVDVQVLNSTLDRLEELAREDPSVFAAVAVDASLDIELRANAARFCIHAQIKKLRLEHIATDGWATVHRLSQDSSSLVRIGVVEGLEDAEERELLEQMLQHEQEPAVRQSIRMALRNLKAP